MPKIGARRAGDVKDGQDLDETPVIVLTVSEREEDVVKAYDSGASSYVHKPVDSEKFRRVIKTVQEYWKIPDLFLRNI